VESKHKLQVYRQKDTQNSRNKVQGHASTIHPTCGLLNTTFFFSSSSSDVRKQTLIGKWHVFNPLTARWLNHVPIAYNAFAQPVSHHFQCVTNPSWPRYFSSKHITKQHDFIQAMYLGTSLL